MLKNDNKGRRESLKRTLTQSENHASSSCPSLGANVSGIAPFGMMKTKGEDKDSKSVSFPEKAEVQSEGVESAGGG